MNIPSHKTDPASELEQISGVCPPNQKMLAASVIYSLFYFLPVYSMTFNTVQWVLKLSLYIAFLSVYFFIFRVYHQAAKRPEYISVLVICMTLISIAATFITPGSNSLFGYSVFFAMALLPYRATLGVVISVFIAIFVLGYGQFQWNFGFMVPALTITIALTIYGLFERHRLKFESAKQEAKAEIEQLAVIAERERIARDLHDVLGHSLSSIALKSQLAHKLSIAGSHEDSAIEMQQVADIASHALTEVREAVSGYKHSGIQSHIERCVSLLEQNDFSVTGERAISTLTSRVESALILTMKELVTNVLRHSQGNSVEFSMLHKEQTVVLLIKDNGENENKKIRFGNGLTGMHERIKNLSGNIDVSLDNGFSVSITLTNH